LVAVRRRGAGIPIYDYDYVDAKLPVLRRMFAKRLRAYRSLGYELTEV
jgi:hypothetical protein